jgi:hypothetical protein
MALLKSLIILFLTGFSIQQNTTSTPTMNTCAKMMDARMPVKPSDCTSDKSYAGNNCCYISSTLSGQTTALCYLVPTGVDVSNIPNIVDTLGATAKVDCGSAYISISLILAFIVAFLF